MTEHMPSSVREENQIIFKWCWNTNWEEKTNVKVIWLLYIVIDLKGLNYLNEK